jgi:hypothetical protein
MPNRNSNKKKVKKVVVKIQKRSQSRRQRAPQQRRVRRRGGLSNAFGSAAKEIGSSLGFPKLGAILGNGIQRIFGRGDYVISGPVRSNSIMNGGGFNPPQFGNGQMTVVAHREFLMDVTTGPTLVNSLTSFNTQSFAINPGLNSTFPWLSQIANNFEEYEILGMIFEYKSTSANALNSTNTALGTVILTTCYNVLDAAFINKQQQENYEFAQSVKPADSCIHAVECARFANPLSKLYVRAGVPTASTYDLRMYDLGNFQLSTVGMQAANVVIGEFWVSYHIALGKPRLPIGGIEGDVPSFHIAMTAVSSTNILGTNNVPNGGSTLACTINITANTITFPFDEIDGQYLITYAVYCNSAALTTPSVTATSNCSASSHFYKAGANPFAFAPTSGTTDTRMLYQYAVTITGPSAVVTFSTLTIGGSASGDLIIAPINPAQV